MKNLILLLVTLAMSSCAFIKKGEVHEKMAKSLESKTYTYSIPELQIKVIDFIKTSRQMKKIIVMPMIPNGQSSLGSGDEAKRAMKDGFIFKGKSYTTIVPLDSQFFVSTFNQIKEEIQNVPFNILESDDNHFLIQKENLLYEAEKLAAPAQGSSLKVYILTTLVEASLDEASLSQVILRALGKIGKPVDLLASREYQQRNLVEELKLFFELEAVSANAMENQLSAE